MNDAAAPAHWDLEIGALSDKGTQRPHNEDFCASYLETPGCAIVAVADGVSGDEGGEVASQTALEAMLAAYREEDSALAAGQRLYRATQNANIAVYDRASVVPELRGMSTTLTAVAVDRGELTCVHVGDSRLYLLSGGSITQLTKDHTVAAERERMGLISAERARTHPDRSVLTRSVGRELIVNRDRISRRVLQGDALLLCSDGLYNVLSDAEILEVASGLDAATACRRLIDAANARGTFDNVTAAVLRIVGETPEPIPEPGLKGRIRRLLRR
jgi:protein phosphatase